LIADRSQFETRKLNEFNHAVAKQIGMVPFVINSLLMLTLF
jgi:hypothetical protein